MNSVNLDIDLIDTIRVNEDTLSPEEYLNLSEEQKSDILMVSPVVKPLGACNIDDSNFVSMRIKWKTPRYTVNL